MASIFLSIRSLCACWANVFNMLKSGTELETYVAPNYHIQHHDSNLLGKKLFFFFSPFFKGDQTSLAQSTSSDGQGEQTQGEMALCHESIAAALQVSHHGCFLFPVILGKMISWATPIPQLPPTLHA